MYHLHLCKWELQMAHVQSSRLTYMIFFYLALKSVGKLNLKMIIQLNYF